MVGVTTEVPVLLEAVRLEVVPLEVVPPEVVPPVAVLPEAVLPVVVLVLVAWATLLKLRFNMLRRVAKRRATRAISIKMMPLTQTMVYQIPHPCNTF